MKKHLKRILYFLSVVTLVALMPLRTTLAYIDPATSSYVIQIIAGVVIACGAAVGIFWKRIRMFFRNRKIKRLENKLNREAEKNIK